MLSQVLPNTSHICASLQPLMWKCFTEEAAIRRWYKGQNKTPYKQKLTRCLQSKRLPDLLTWWFVSTWARTSRTPLMKMNPSGLHIGVIYNYSSFQTGSHLPWYLIIQSPAEPHWLPKDNRLPPKHFSRWHLTSDNKHTSPMLYQTHVGQC